MHRARDEWSLLQLGFDSASDRFRLLAALNSLYDDEAVEWRRHFIQRLTQEGRAELLSRDKSQALAFLSGVPARPGVLHRAVRSRSNR